jgi:hypothetical protein
MSELSLRQAEEYRDAWIRGEMQYALPGPVYEPSKDGPEPNTTCSLCGEPVYKMSIRKYKVCKVCANAKVKANNDKRAAQRRASKGVG